MEIYLSYWETIAAIVLKMQLFFLSQKQQKSTFLHLGPCEKKFKIFELRFLSGKKSNFLPERTVQSLFESKSFIVRMAAAVQRHLFS